MLLEWVHAKPVLHSLTTGCQGELDFLFSLDTLSLSHFQDMLEGWDGWYRGGSGALIRRKTH